MSILSNITGDFYDQDYFENGRDSNKSWYTNFHWMPRRSFREALAFIESLNLNEGSKVLEIGCAKGFLVRAMRTLEIPCDGADISDYALSFAPEGCWNCSSDVSWKDHEQSGYTHILIKDMLEHLTHNQLEDNLKIYAKTAPVMMCVVPFGDNGKYRIKEYHYDVSHLIAENESWWSHIFVKNGWKIKQFFHHVDGLKDNWFLVNPKGNGVFILERK